MIFLLSIFARQEKFSFHFYVINVFIYWLAQGFSDFFPRVDYSFLERLQVWGDGPHNITVATSEIVYIEK